MIIILKIYIKIQLIINILNLQYSKSIEWNQRKSKYKTTWIQEVMNLTSNSAFKFYKQAVSNKKALLVTHSKQLFNISWNS